MLGLIVTSQLGLIAVLDAHPTALPETDGGAAPAPAASVPAEPVPAEAPAAAVAPAAVVDPAVAALCMPLAGKDPCGPDLDLDADGDYLNFFAQAEGVLPSSYFSTDEAGRDRPFDRSKVDLAGQLEAIKPLLKRTRDLRLLIMLARLHILNKDLAGFAVAVAAAGRLLETSWDEVHPRPQGDDLTMRSMAVAGLAHVPTAVLPLQYAPLFDVPRVGVITYRGLMIAAGEVKPREERAEACSRCHPQCQGGNAAPELLAAARSRSCDRKGTALEQIRNAFLLHGALGRAR